MCKEKENCRCSANLKWRQWTQYNNYSIVDHNKFDGYLYVDERKHRQCNDCQHREFFPNTSGVYNNLGSYNGNGYLVGTLNRY